MGDLYRKIAAGGCHGVSFNNNNHRVMKWSEDAKVRRGCCWWSRSPNPHGIFVDHLKSVYVADLENHRVACWSPGVKHGTVIFGGNGEGRQTHQFNGPIALLFDREGNSYVVDHRNKNKDIC
ncbi:unnamed protein product [Adineta ricciae]|uniref:Uncharacterized protein n=1 Tax=Adineta ricciae TaxID=249248 RepID=A0A816CGC8_ADIRI|nr:unnamed protein product [Adineta ricciae]CAF1624241.1 unnamed protein product [Adineta ricciae]